MRKKEKRQKPESFSCGNGLRPVVHWEKVALDYKRSEVKKGVDFFTSFELIGKLNPARSCLLDKTK